MCMMYILYMEYYHVSNPFNRPFYINILSEQPE